MVSSTKRRRQNKSNNREEKEEESCTETAAFSFMSIVPDELLLQILIRLTTLRSLIQCTLVCRSWYSLIDHQFISNFIKFLNHRPRLHVDDDDNDDGAYQIMPYTMLFRKMIRNASPTFFQLFSKQSKYIHEKKNTYEIHLTYLPWGESVIRASSYDLLLVSPKFNRGLFYICHLLTGKWIKLPNGPPSINRYRTSQCGLVAKPNRKANHHSTIDEQYSYKLVLIQCRYIAYDVFSFCSDTGIWTRSELPPTTYFATAFPHMDDSVSSTNGFVYWLVTDMDEVKGLVSYNPFGANPEQCRFMKLDFLGRNGMVYREKICMGIVRGQLRLSSVHSEGVYFCMRIWELNNFEWILVHEGRLKKTSQYKSMCVLAFHPNIPDVIFLSRNFELFRYEIKANKFERHGRFPADEYETIGPKYFYKYLRVLTLLHPPSSIPYPPQPWSID